MTVGFNPNVALFDPDGTSTRVMQYLLGSFGITVPNYSVPLVDERGRATDIFRQYLSQVATTPLPNPAVPLSNPDGTPTRVMTHILMALP